MEFYLLSFRLNGLKNIEKEIRLDFYKKTIRNFNREKYNVKGIFGRNGIGKTAIIKGIELFRNIILYKDYLFNKKDLSELVNKKSNKIFLSVEYLILENKKKTVFEHSIWLKKENNEIKIIKEKVVQKDTGRNNDVKVLIVENGKIDKENSNFFKDFTEVEIYSMNLLDKLSIVTLIGENEVKKYLENRKINKKFKFKNTEFIDMILFFRNIGVFTHEKDRHYGYMLSKQYEDKEIRDVPLLFLNLYLSDLDGINYIAKTKKAETKLKKILEKKLEFLKIYKPDLLNIKYEKKERKDYYEIDYIFCYKNYNINLEFESMGMKSLFGLYDYISNISKGGIVFIDEIDASIHDVYLNKLIKFFAENGKGQFIFTAHNTSILDTLKKYKNSIDFFTEKAEIQPWIKNGNYSPRTQYIDGMLENMPFNIKYYDFFEILDLEGDNIE
ncbi:MAG: AAA family ATPase [Leptotrichiaceae bacterium]|nr:AAA family ATPase [Leptotrichiaceae bacterium]